MLSLISAAHAQGQTGAKAPPGAEWMNIGFLVVLFVVFYLIAIRPQRKRQKEHTEMLGSLEKGDEVVTSSGILGKIVRIEDDYLLLKVTDTVELKFQKAAVHAVLPKGTLKSI